MVSHQPTKVYYPDSDGKPMADNTKQFRWIVTIKENLDSLFATDPHVFVAGDLLWYPVEGDNTLRAAPDAMVVFGRPKGDRGSYRQWQEDNIPPQVVFEILSPGNRLGEMERKRQFYELYGVEEYYLYDPDRLDASGWIRQADRLVTIPELNNWTSDRLGIRFSPIEGEELIIYRPDGERFLSFGELAELRQAEKMRADTAEMRADTAEREVERLAAKLRALGIEP